jgi:hypothetical protein
METTTYDLGQKQAQAVRELMEAVDEALGANILVPIDFAASREKLNVKSAEFVEWFPKLDGPAEEFYFADMPYAPEWIEEAEDYTSVAFDVLLSTHSVKNAATLSSYTHALETLRSELGDLATWSSQWDNDKGVWK